MLIAFDVKQTLHLVDERSKAKVRSKLDAISSGLAGSSPSSPVRCKASCTKLQGVLDASLSKICEAAPPSSMRLQKGRCLQICIHPTQLERERERETKKTGKTCLSILILPPAQGLNARLKEVAAGTTGYEKSLASLFLVVRPGATSSFLAPSSDALCY